MSVRYYYTPLLIQPEGEPHEGIAFPAKDDGGGVVAALNEMPPNFGVLYQDNEAPRFVLRQPDTMPVCSLGAWETKTAEEVNDDYPGLIP